MSLVRKFEDSAGEMPSPDTAPDSHGPPPPKKKFVYEPHRIANTSEEGLNYEVLKFQHSKLKVRLEQRLKAEQTLQDRIEQLEKRQTKDDAVLNVINRYWNQLNEDVRILLQRFDSETSDEAENQNENEYTTSFLTQLATWDKEELDQKLASRVTVSTRAVAKVIQAFDRLQQRSLKLTEALEAESEVVLSEAVRERNRELELDNIRLQSLNTSLHEAHRALSLKAKELEEKVGSEETKADEYRNRVDDLSWEVAKLQETKDKLEACVSEHADQMRRHKEVCQMGGKRDCDLPLRKQRVSDAELDDLRKDMEEVREVAANRLVELERLQETQKATLEEVERLRMDLRTLPDSVIMETTEYKSLQSKFSLVYNDSLEMRQTVEATRRQLAKLGSANLRTTEQLESEELLGQKKLRTELIQQEDLLCQVRKEYEMLRIEFEQNLAANEQVGPMSREMRTLLTSLQNHNHQLKADLTRLKRKHHTLLEELSEVRREKEEIQRQLEPAGTEPQNHAPHPQSPSNDCTIIEPNNKLPSRVEKLLEEVKDLKSELKQSQLCTKETRLLLDMHKGLSKEERDKAQLMAAEKKLRAELDLTKAALTRAEERERTERKKICDEDKEALIVHLKERERELTNQLAMGKSEQEACISEMEVTGQGFEDMQEQNSRLLQQLKEKDDANFKLMSDKIKTNQLIKLTREEREVLKEQLETLTKQLEAQNQVVRKLEEMEKTLVNSLSFQEKEGRLRITSAENNKRKAIESAQSATELRLHLEKYHSQMKEAQQTVAEKTSALEAEAFKARRFQEQIAALSRKVERLNRIEEAGNTDAVLLEEIREYKESLTCPSCKVKRKDAVLTKCFHVFCFDCIRTRYETRQRKCPKCNAAFGANDYHRLYLT